MAFPRSNIPRGDDNSLMSDLSLVDHNTANGVNRPAPQTSGDGLKSTVPTMARRHRRASQEIPPAPALQQRKMKKLKSEHSETPAPQTSSKTLINKPISPPQMPKQPFDLFHKMLMNTEIGYLVATYLDMNSLITLYSISKDFHILLNMRLSSIITRQAMLLAPESAQIFHFKCYSNLCIKDPYHRANAEVEGAVRDVPSFRWLKFVLWREKAVKGIIACLAVEGLHMPRSVSTTIKKLWVLMDIRDSPRRIRLVQNPQIWTNRDLFLATLFFIKLDMRLMDAIDGNTCNTFRKMLMSYPGLTKTYRILTRQELLTDIDALQAWVRWNVSPDAAIDGEPICGVKPDEIGRFAREDKGWGRRPLIIRPDDLIMKEAARRGLDMTSRYMDMMLFGFVDKSNFRDIWSRPIAKRPDGVDVDEAEEGLRGFSISL